MILKKLKACGFGRLAWCLVLLVSFSWSGESEKNAASKYLKNLNNDVIVQVLGLSSASKVTLVVGEPISLWRITKETAANYSGSRLLPDLLEEPTSMLVPVYSSDTLVAYVRILSVKGSWVAKEFGYASLAREMKIVQKTWPTSAGHELILVENQALREFFFSIANYSFVNLTPFRFVDADDAAEDSAKYRTLESPDAVVRRVIELALGGSYENR